jgi:hypothetical protein
MQPTTLWNVGEIVPFVCDSWHRRHMKPEVKGVALPATLNGRRILKPGFGKDLNPMVRVGDLRQQYGDRGGSQG